MRILVLSQYWYPENGVPQRRWRWLAHLLTENGHELSVIAPWPGYRRKVNIRVWLQSLAKCRMSSVEIGPAGETIYRSMMIPTGSSITWRAIGQAINALFGLINVIRVGFLAPKDQRPSLIIGTVPALPTALLTWISAKVLRVPYVIDLRDAWPDLLANTRDWNIGVQKRSVREVVLSRGPLQILTYLTDKMLKKVLSESDGIIVTADELRRNLECLYPKQATRATIVTIRNVFPRRNIPVKKAVNLVAGSRLNVLYAGTLGRAQNLSNAIEAAEIARREGVDIALKFVGAGAGLGKLKARAARSNVHIEFVDHIEVNELQTFYEWADTALVHLTDWAPLERAVPSKTYELMTSRIHISGVAVGEAKELIEKLEAGEVVPPESPTSLAQLWKRLYEDRSLLQVSSYSRDWVVDQQRMIVPEVLDSLLARVVK